MLFIFMLFIDKEMKLVEMNVKSAHQVVRMDVKLNNKGK